MIIIYGILLGEFIAGLGLCIKLTHEIFKEEKGTRYCRADGPACTMI